MNDHQPSGGRLWRLLAIRCAEASELASRERDVPLGPWDRWALRLHRVNCRPCRRLHRQLGLLGDTARGLADGEGTKGPGLPESVRERIKRFLRGQ